MTPYSQLSCSQLVVLGHRVKVVESGEFWVTLQNTSCSSSCLCCLRLSAPQICVVGTFPRPMWGIIRNAPPLKPIPSLPFAFQGLLGRAELLEVLGPGESVWNSRPIVSEDFDDLSRDAHRVTSSSWESFPQLLVTGRAIHW